MLREKDKGPLQENAKMLESAKQILISELVLVQGVDVSEINDALDSLSRNIRSDVLFVHCAKYVLEA